jgi:hypothetical protein
VIVLLVVMASLVMDFNSRMAELRRLSAENSIVSGQVTRQVQTRQALEAQIAYATSDAAVWRWAYEDAHMIRPGDNAVIPVQVTGAPPTPTPTPAPPLPEVPNWQRWISLFLGPISP